MSWGTVKLTKYTSSRENLFYAIWEKQRRWSNCASVIRCLDRIMPLVSISEISRLELVAVAEQVGWSLTWSHTSEDRFSHDLAWMICIQWRLRSACMSAQSCWTRWSVESLATHRVHSEYPDQTVWMLGWLGWAMMLSSFQCRGVLLLLHLVGQGPAVFAAGAGRVGYSFYIFHLSSLSNVLSFGRRLNMTEILSFRLLNPNGSCQLLQRTSSLSTG